MKIRVAKHSGFCMGVRRAVEMALDASGEYQDPFHTYGPLIHNPQVLDVLEEKGIRILDEIPDKGLGTVLIRAHGVPPETNIRLKKSGFHLLDATCPRVIKIQTIIRKYARQDHAVIIIGDKNHAEVIGLIGFADRKAYVISSLEQFDRLPVFNQAIIVAQTTQNTQLFDLIRERAESRFPHYKVFNTICDSTEKRQADVRRLSKKVDAILVVGGHNSGNTQRLVEIAKESEKPVFHIETETDLRSIDSEKYAAARHIGITAGASTPNWIIRKVYRALEQNPRKKERGLSRFLMALQRILLLADIYVSLGAGCLCYACSSLLGLSGNLPYIILAILYVQSMHLLNHLTGTNGDVYNDPDREAFYLKNKRFLMSLSILAGSSGLIGAFMLGPWPLILFILMSALGISYKLKIIPISFFGSKYRRIKDIPGSKTFLISMAWGIFAAVMPPLALYGKITWVNGLLFLWASGLVFVRTAFFDVLDMQGDRIVGKETIAIILGEKRMIRLLEVILIGLIVLLPVMSIYRLGTSLGFLLVMCPISMLIILFKYKKGNLLPGLRLEFLVESLFILAGVITVFWNLIS
jgi:4-hydroxy-3-methylbut-2-enyl diphosphate reductase